MNVFNETTFMGAIDCATLKAECLARYPLDADGNDPKDALGNSLLLRCIDTQNADCYQAVGYDNPGATTYPIDIVTNTDNPGYLLPDLGLGGWNTPAIIALAVGAVLLFSMMRR